MKQSIPDGYHANISKRIIRYEKYLIQSIDKWVKEPTRVNRESILRYRVLIKELKEIQKELIGYQEL